MVLTDREPRALYCALSAAAANGLSVSPMPKEIAAAEDDDVELPEVLSFENGAFRKAGVKTVAAAEGEGKGEVGAEGEGGSRRTSLVGLFKLNPVDP